MNYFQKALPYDYEPEPHSFKPRKWPKITPELHVKIKRLYQNKAGCSGEVKTFAKIHGLPRWKIGRYAQRQGWIATQKKEPPWADKEIRILKDHAQHCPDVIQRHLKKAGYSRSLNGIVLKRKRMRFLSNLEGQSANSLAMCLGVDLHFVTKAINAGELKAARRITKRTPQQGGDIYLISDGAVKKFILKNIHKIDLRKVDKYWFVEILAGKDLL